MAGLISRAFGWLHCPSWGLLIAAAILLGLAPFTNEPHLIGKLRLLVHGELVRPIDILDLLWHGWPIVWLALRLLTPSAAAYCRIPER